MKIFILLLICIIVKLIYLNKIIRYDFFSLYSILSVEIKNIIKTLVIKPGLTWRVDSGPDTPTA
jgi:hypothetical protein